MKFKKLINCASFLFLFIFAINSVSGQRIYDAGYLVRENGDTLKGFISYSGFGRESKLVFFKENEAEEGTGFATSAVKGFSSNGQFFETTVVETEVTPFNLDKLEVNPQQNIETDTVFLLVLVKGSKSLCFYQNRVGKDQFYIKIDSVCNLLMYKKYLREIDGNRMYIENKNYLGQLTYFLNDCPTIQKKLKNCTYWRSELEQLFLEYNNCMGTLINDTSAKVSSAKVYSKKKKQYVEAGVLAGGSVTYINLGKLPQDAMVTLEKNYSYNPMAGLFLNIGLQRNRRNLFFYNELLYSSFFYKGRTEKYTNENNYDIADSRIGYKAVRLNSMLRFQIPVKAYNLYVNAGMSYGVVSQIEEGTILMSHFYTTERVYYRIAIPEFVPDAFSYMGGFGASNGHYSFDVRYDVRGDISNHVDYKIGISKFYFLLGYRF